MEITESTINYLIDMSKRGDDTAKALLKDYGLRVYYVEMEQRLTKTIEVVAGNPDSAEEMAHEVFEFEDSADVYPKAISVLSVLGD